MGKPRYFLGIEFAYGKDRIVLTQRKYTLDLLHETGLLGCKPENTLIEQSPCFWDSTATLFEEVDRYTSERQINLFDSHLPKYFVCCGTIGKELFVYLPTSRTHQEIA